MAEDLSRLLEIKSEREREEATSKRYPALRVISGLYRMLAYLSAAVAVIGVMLGIVEMSGPYGEAAGVQILLLSLVCGVLLFITFFAIAEAIHVFIDIEENTRRTSSALGTRS